MATIQKVGAADSVRAAEMKSPLVQAKTEPCAAAASPEAVETHVHCDQKTILPLALRDDEITARDAETLFRIAEDKNAAAGRLRRKPKSIPTIEPARAKAD